MCRTKYPGDRREPPEGATLTGVIGRIGRLQIAYISYISNRAIGKPYKGLGMTGPDTDCTLENPTKEWVPKVQSAVRESLRRKDRDGFRFFWCVCLDR